MMDLSGSLIGREDTYHALLDPPMPTRSVSVIRHDVLHRMKACVGVRQCSANRNESGFPRIQREAWE
jgi:hypothetical protein